MGALASVETINYYVEPRENFHAGLVLNWDYAAIGGGVARLQDLQSLAFILEETDAVLIRFDAEKPYLIERSSPKIDFYFGTPLTGLSLYDLEPVVSTKWTGLIQRAIKHKMPSFGYSRPSRMPDRAIECGAFPLTDTEGQITHCLCSYVLALSRYQTA